ncbi:DUF3883 domain-containing protein [Salinicoccus hispanicus]|uniref:DUF3883 domain-containing protein n=1 Tax=Salinicoccus hispanicus TaxID=157225 RepID=A0A6N8U1X3_9STAP|nr:DUF3883 domain-containing protein [Salinicoccus hispanicus]
MPSLEFNKKSFTPQRLKEFNSFNEKEKAEVVYSYLFKGLSHRKLEEEILDKHNHGYAAMNILHHYGIISKHKYIFREKSLQAVIKLLETDKLKEYTTIKNLLESIQNNQLNNNYLKNTAREESDKSLYVISPQPTSVVKEDSENYDSEEYINNLITEEDLELRHQYRKRIGKAGEKLVLEYYIEKIKVADIESSKKDFLISNILDVSQIHGYGYDIVAYDLDTLSRSPQEIYIEVKTTKSKELNEPFYLSKNEALCGMRLGSRYRIGRVIDINSSRPKYFEISPFKNSNTELDLITNLEMTLEIEASDFIVRGWKI